MQPVEVYGKILLKYKVHSYLYKGVSESEIKKHIESFIKLENHHFSKQFDKDNNPFSSLAVRELEVLHYLLNGYRTKEISTTLGLKMNTISTIKAVIFDKVKADNFTHLLQLALTNSLKRSRALEIFDRISAVAGSFSTYAKDSPIRAKTLKGIEQKIAQNLLRMR